MTLQKGLSVFIPVFNEEEIIENNLAVLMAYLTKLGMQYEIIIVNNGSTDNSQRILKDICKKYPVVKVEYITQKAVGLAIQKGVAIARYDSFITVDMDLSINLGFISEVTTFLGDYDIIVGSKITGSQERTMLRKIASNAFIFGAGKLLGMNFNDYSIAAKAYKSGTLKKYITGTNDQTFYVVEVLLKAHLAKVKIKEIPVSCTDLRPSKFNLIHEGIHKFGNLFLLWLKLKLCKHSKTTRFPTSQDLYF